MKSGIYAIINRSNNKIYVGQSVDIQERWKEHKTELSQGIHHNVAMQNDYNNGDKFDFRVLCNCVDLDDQEKYYIKKYDSYYNSYNQTRGGSGNNQDPLNLPYEKSSELSNIKSSEKSSASKHSVNIFILICTIFLYLIIVSFPNPLSYILPSPTILFILLLIAVIIIFYINYYKYIK